MTTNLSGRLLIASPYLTDGNFMRSVVFMIRHDVEGAFGLAINRPTERRFRDLVEMSDADAVGPVMMTTSIVAVRSMVHCSPCMIWPVWANRAGHLIPRANCCRPVSRSVRV